MSHLPPDPNLKPQSRSENIFDWAVYGGIAGIGAFVLTIPVAFWAKYGKGAKHFESATQWLTKRGINRETAEQVMMTSATMQGGNLMVLPVKWAEDHKIELVGKIDDMIGEHTDRASLEAEDRQSWSSMVKARIVAWLAVFTSLKLTGHAIGVEKFAHFENKFAETVCHTLGKATHVAGKETAAFQNGKIAAIDTFATAAATSLLYIGSRIFAHWERKPQTEHAHDATSTSTPIPIEPHAAQSKRTPRLIENGYAAAVTRQAETRGSLQLT